MNKIINGDSLKVLKKLEDDSVDMVCTDPPYGYSFMGKDWDKAVPSIKIWKECLRVLKPGGFCFVMSAPRADVQSRMMVRLEDAGFDIGITPIYWTYATGFPKASNVGKMVDKRLGKKRKVLGPKINVDGSKSRRTARFTNAGKNISGMTDGGNLETKPAPDEAKQLEGSYAGFQPKPAVEIVLVAMKPISEKSYVDQAMKNGKGVTWLNDCRVPYEDNCRLERGGSYVGDRTGSNAKSFYQQGNENIDYDEPLPQGRFPANLIVQDDILNDGKNRKGGSSNGDATVGTSTDGAITPLNRGTLVSRNDDGSFSRFYDLDAWWESRVKELPESVQKTFPFMIVPKASKSEKNKGLDEFEDKLPDTNDFKNLPAARSNSINTSSGKPRKVLPSKNNHPTVKPIELMSYLITLGSREGDIVVDPFVGSGTTCVAASLLDREYVGIEKEEDYVMIAKARIKTAKKENNDKAKEFFDL
jgi:DNA modification methylase